MPALSEIRKPFLQPAGAGFSASRRRRNPAHSRLPALAFVFLAVGAGALISYYLTSSSNLEVVWALMVITCGLPVTAAQFLNRRIRARRPEREVLRRAAGLDLVEKAAEAADKTPAGLLVVSRDMRIRFVNHTFLDAAIQSQKDVLGWRLEDVLPAAGLENQAKALLNRPYIATSCCLTSLPGRQSVSITMTRIPPIEGEDRILVVVEDLLQSFPLRQIPLVEGYIC